MNRILAAFILYLYVFTGGLPALAAGTLSAQPNADYYEFDKPHTQILFSVDHLGFSHSHGRFLDYDGHFTLDRNHPERASVEVVIHTASVDMGDESWNKEVKQIFKTDEFPDMTFESTGIKRLSEDNANVKGNLTLLGVTRPVTLHVKFNKAGRNPFGKYICGFSAYADVKRSEFGMSDYLPLVGDDVQITIEVEGDRRDKPNQQQYNP